MNAITDFPIVLKPLGGLRPCATCSVRQISICDAIPESDLMRLGASAIGGVARPGTLFIAESDPASGFMTESLIAAIAQGEDEAKVRLKAFLDKRGPKVLRR